MLFLLTCLTILSSQSKAHARAQLCRSYFAQTDVLNKFSQDEKMNLETTARLLADLIGKTESEDLQAKRDMNVSIKDFISLKKIKDKEILVFKSFLEERIQFYINLKRSHTILTTAEKQYATETLNKQKVELEKIKYILEKYKVENLSEALLSAHQSKLNGVASAVDDILFILDRVEHLEVTDYFFQIVVQYDRLSAVQYFLDHGARLDSRDSSNATPLHFAARYNSNLNIIELLLKADNNAQLNSRDHSQFTPFIFAVRFNPNLEIFKKLLAAGADRTLPQGSRTFLLHAAVSNPHMDTKTLLEFFKVELKEQINEIDSSKNTPLHLAHSKEIIKLLLEAGANPTRSNINNEIPLHVIAANAQMDAATLQLLLKYEPKTQINSQNTWLQTPLLSALNSKKIELVIALLQAGADPSLRDNVGHTALTRAVVNRDIPLEIIRVLIAADQGDRSGSQNKLWDTFLHLAIRNHIDVLKVLLEAGVDPTVPNREGDTPYQLSQTAMLLGTETQQERDQKTELLRQAMEEWEKNHR